MGKKSPKKQQKQPSMADFDNTAPPAVTTTSQPASNPQVDNAHAPTTTQLSFRDFLTIANTEDIKKFLRVAVTTPEGANLFYLWKRAYDEGHQKGRKTLLENLERKMKEKFEEGVERGMNLGREQGYTIAKEAFDKMIVAIKARDTLKVDTTNISTQTNSVVTTGISVQTSA
jgi:flagellar biosynthesis/type III secretory pathway protein FliH